MQHAILEIFLWLFGLCVGSFLNVVIYRLGVGLSIAVPQRSFCPRCRSSIAWHDNLPVLSWLLLRGRCRHCQQPIAVQYPLVEALTGLSFVLVYHLLVVEQTRAGLELGLPGDLPLVLGWLALVACLIVCAAMDIVSYSIDIRVTNFVLGLGIVLHAAWPRETYLVRAADGASAAGAVAAFIVGLLVMLWLQRRDQTPEEEAAATADEVTPDHVGSGGAGTAGLFGALALVAVTLWLVYLAAAPADALLDVAGLPVAATMLLIFLVTAMAGGQQRPADDEIHAAIEEEQPQARRQVLLEFAQLLPAILVGVVVLVLVQSFPAFSSRWQHAVAWSPGGGFVPLAGIAFAVLGAVTGAVAGWALRITFTLVYGREAFGVGDIYILATAGAVAGWDVVLLGLLFSVGIALCGWLLGLLAKRTVMIPFGPWLAIGFVVALWWNEPAVEQARGYLYNIRFAWDRRPDLLLTAAGLMLVGSAAAIVLSRLVRRWAEPDSA